jgi:hypothetical protein
MTKPKVEKNNNEVNNIEALLRVETSQTPWVTYSCRYVA